MDIRLFKLPAFGWTSRDAATVAGRVLAFLAWMGAVVAFAALWVVVVLFLRLLRTFILTMLFLAIVGGVGTGVAFAYGHYWQDAMQAALVAFVCAVAFVVYSALALLIDPKHFENTAPAWWQRH